MRFKRCGSLILAALLTLSLCACRAAAPAKGDMSIAPAQLTEEEAALAALLGVEMDGFRIFDFDVAGGEEGVKSVQLTAYELKGDEWSPVVRERTAVEDGKGRIALGFGKVTDEVYAAVQSAGGGFEARRFQVEAEDDVSSMVYGTTVLGECAGVEFEAEVPLVIQIATTKSEINSYGVKYFGMPREYAKHGYEHVYAITVMFSQKTVYELADSAAPEQ